MKKRATGAAAAAALMLGLSLGIAGPANAVLCGPWNGGGIVCHTK